MRNFSAFACPGRGLGLIALLLLSAASPVFATENGSAVYPAGVETVLPGLTPPPATPCSSNSMPPTSPTD